MRAEIPMALQSTVQQLIRTYRWGLLAEAALCQQVWQPRPTRQAQRGKTW